MIQFLFNPFKKLAGLKALGLGWLVMLLTSMVAYFSHCRFDGALDVHIAPLQAPWWIYLLDTFVAWGIISIFLYLGGLVISQSKIRARDIFGTVALARFPMFFVSLVAFGVKPPPAGAMHFSISAMLLTFCILAFSIWMIALLYNAYTLCCNIKGIKAVISFIASLLLAEIVSKIIYLKWFLPFILPKHRL